MSGVQVSRWQTWLKLLHRKFWQTERKKERERDRKRERKERGRERKRERRQMSESLKE